MKKKLRRSLWGLQWIFLKNEKKGRKTKQNRNSMDFQLEDSVASDVEEFPEVIMRKLSDYEAPSIKVNQASTKEKYKMSHIEDLPNLSYKNPHIYLETGNDRLFPMAKEKPERKSESTKNSRPKTVEIRRVVYPDRFIQRVKKIEANTISNRRKSYGKWFIPPDKWKQSLDSFILKNS